MSDNPDRIIGELYRNVTNYNEGEVINILVFGPTGVGKSTWINAIINYLKFDTLQQAMEVKDPLYAIPAYFYHQGRKVQLGKPTASEQMKKGEAATKDPNEYLVEHIDRSCGTRLVFRFIDTAGAGDTDGIDEDKKNLAKLFAFIEMRKFKGIHAICFLLKSNEARLTQYLQYSFAHLFSNLPKSVTPSIFFVFTNARTSFYKDESSGDCIPLLHSFLERLEKEHSVKIEQNDSNSFFMDNEAFRLLIALANGEKFDEDIIPLYELSWKKAKKTTIEFLLRISTATPQSFEKMLKLNEARKLIVFLGPVLVNATKSIEAKRELSKEYDKRLEEIDLRKERIAKDLMKKVHTMDVKECSPRLVCMCRQQMKSFGNGTIIKTFTSSCIENIPFGDLRSLEDLIKNSSTSLYCGFTIDCFQCGCSYNRHLLQRYETIERLTYVEDSCQRATLNDLETIRNFAMEKKRANEIEKSQLDAGMEAVMNTSAQFASFIGQNAIIKYCKSFTDYLKVEIQNAEELCAATRDKKMQEIYRAKIRGFQKSIAAHEEEKRLIDEGLKKGIRGEVNVDDIKKLVEKLIALPIIGKEIKQQLDMEMRTAAKCNSGLGR